MKTILAALCICLLPLPLVNADQMELVKLHVDSFTVIGFELRTANAREATADGAIGPLWQRLASERFINRISHRVDDRIIAVYGDYESDKDGPYTYTLGAKVSSARDIPPGMVARKVLSGSYAMFTAQGSSPEQMTVDLWKQIWSLEKPRQLHRAYRSDFEVHYNDPESQRPRIDIYIGVQK